MRKKRETKQRNITGLEQASPSAAEPESIETERERAVELLRIQGNLGIALARTSDLTETFSHLLESVCLVEGIDCGGVYLVHKTTGDLDLICHIGLPKRFVECVSHFAAHSPQAHLVASGNPLSGIYAEVSPATCKIRQSEGLRAVAIIPVQYDGQTVAVLNLGSHTHDEIPLSTRRALEAIATQIGGVVARVSAEEALKESKSDFQCLFDTIDDFLFILDSQGRIVKVNDLVKRRLGYPEEELSGMNVIKVHPPDQREEAVAIITNMLAGKDTVCTIPLMTKDGTLIPVETKVTPGKWGGQSVLIGISRDITERKQAEDKLREEHSFRTAVIQRAAEGLCVCHAIEEYPYVQFTLWNDRMTEITGYTMEEINRLGWYQTMYPDPAAQTRAIKRMGSMRTGDDIIAEEWKITRADGDKRILSISTSVLSGADGAAHVLALMHDVTERKRAQEKFMEGAKLLEQNSMILEVMTGQMADMVYYKDNEFRYIFSSKPHCERILKCSQTECVGKTDVEIANMVRERGHRQDFGEICNDSDTETMKAGEPSIFIEEGLIDDEYVCLEVYKTPIYDGERFAGIVGCSRDITERRRIEKELRKYRDHLEELVEERTTELKRANDQLQDEIAERKRAEEALRESEGRYRNVYSTAPLAFVIWDRDCRITDWNERAERIFGWSREEVLGLNFFGFLIPREARPQVESVVQHLLLGDLPSRSINENLTKSGERILCEWNNSILYDDEGRVMGAISLALDITERKRAEEALEESHNIINRSPAVVFLWKNEQGWPVEFATENVREIFGYTAGDFISGSVKYKDVIHPDDLDKVVGEVARFTSEQGKTSLIHQPYRIVTKEGKVKWLDDRTYIRRDPEGRITHYQGIVLDITERNLLEAQLQRAQKLEAVGTLAGGVAHDFNNLLQVVQGYAELLLLNKGEQHPEYLPLQAIVSAAKRGGDLTERLLTFSRRVESQLRPVNLNLEVQKALRILERTIPKMIAVEANLAPDLELIGADPAQIGQILVNLAVNAKDAMPEGGKLTMQTENVILDEDFCRLQPGAKPGKHVLLRVADTGCGMDKETLGHIYEPFFTTKGLGKGTGLGLAMVFGIVKSHGGHIECDSLPGAGATFNIYFPAIEQIPEPGEETEIDVMKRGTETILLVDDEDFIRDMCSKLLRIAGYKVHTVTNGENALELYRKEYPRIGLVILDLIMPGMGGRMCLEELLKIDPQVKVLIASGYSSEGSARQALELGARGFISKPYTISQMLEGVRNVLDQE